jgi:hypothetical protein
MPSDQPGDDVYCAFHRFNQTMIAAIEDIATFAENPIPQVNPMRLDPPRFEVDDSGPFGNPFDPNRIQAPHVVEPTPREASFDCCVEVGGGTKPPPVESPSVFNHNGFQVTRHNVGVGHVKYYCSNSRAKNAKCTTV